MKFQVQIYVKDGTDLVLLDLFEDESIQVKSSVQDIQDIAMVFTDFSQTFTIPASKTNNAVFKHYYNNDLDQFNANVRIEARIEINRTPFRRGLVQLEGADIKDGQVEPYKITFYGDVVTLKDLIGNDKLKDLNYTAVATTYNGATVENSITSTSDLDVRFPLISSERLWSYTGGSSTDITQTASAMVWSELFPALKDAAILSLIESKYGVTFTGNFLTDKRFTNSFKWWKNRETADFLSEPFDMTFDFSGIADSNSPTYPMLDTADEINILGFNFNLLGATNPITSAELNIKIQVFNLSNSDPYNVDVYKNGVFYQSYQPPAGQLTQVVTELTVGSSNFLSIDDVYTFKIRTTGSATFDYTIQYLFSYTETQSNPFPTPPTLLTTTENYQVTETSNATTANFDFNTSAPDIKISDWLSGILKQFNLTCYPTSNDLEFQIEPLQDWYAGGEDVDITQYIDTDKITIERPKLYNEIAFKWQESKSFMNEAYKETNDRNYGELSELFPAYDGGKYEVKLPFETLLFNNFDTANGNLQVGYALTKSPNYKPYIPKPVSLYLQDSVSPVSFEFNNGSSTGTISSYLPFGQEVRFNNADYTMNFGSEFSTLDLTPKELSLYNVYYKPYLVNLFRSKTRIVTVKEKLPIDVLTRLSLEDAIIIRDKKYRINDLTSDLTTGLTKLVLISDFVGSRRKFTGFTLPSDGGDVVIPIKPPRGGYIDLTITSGTGFSTSNPVVPATNQGEQNWTITAPSNTTGASRQDVYTVTAINSDGSTAYERTVVIDQEDSSFYLLTEDGGYILQENLGRIKL